MAEVIIEGMFMGAEIKTTTYEGNSKTNLVVDIYQQTSQSAEKTVTLKTDDVSLMNKFKEGYDFGSLVQVKASVNAYKNKAYFKLVEVVA